MESQKRLCQNCKNDFTVEPDDFGFYEKIKVPPPTFCPQCRLVRRFASTNERVLYKRKCDFSGIDIFSMYPPDTAFPVYNREDWYSDKWDPYQYGMDYDFSKSFFEQFAKLQRRVPRMALVKQRMSVNSTYTHRVDDMRNCYMVFRTTRGTDSLYTYIAKDILGCMDCFEISQCERCYECIDCDSCFKTIFSQESKECRDCAFVYGCRNCSNCVGCVNQVNQQYLIFNKKYTQEEYKRELEKLGLNTLSGLDNMRKKFDYFRKTLPHKSTVVIRGENYSGNWFTDCKNVKNSFWCTNVKDGKYLFAVFDVEDSMDYFQWGNACEQVYESENVGINSSRIFFCTQCWTGAHDLFYCHSCPGSSNCFGCMGLKKGEYSILNKKYSKAEYEILKKEIIDQMKKVPYVDSSGKEYRFGEHFPDDLSDFAYNETAAIDFFPMTKEEATSKGYRWRDREKREYKTTLKSSSLPESINEVPDSILDEVIECGEKDSQYSVGAYRIVKDELSFYRNMNLPIPKVCFDIRHMRRLRKRPLPVIQKRNCAKCSIEVDTVYPEKDYPILYCEKCYQQEVY